MLHNIVSKLDTRWETFKELFTLKVMRLFILWFAVAPALYQLVSGLRSPLPVEFSGQVSYISLEMPFNWQLLWFSSLLYAASFVMYQLCAPRFIKNYSSFSDYKSSGHDVRWVVWETYYLWSSGYFTCNRALRNKFFKRLQKKNFCKDVGKSFSSAVGSEPSVEKDETVFYFSYEGTVWRVGTPSNEAEEKGLFWEIFGRYSESLKFIRMISRVSLYIAFTLFAIAIMMYVYKGLILAIDSFSV